MLHKILAVFALISVLFFSVGAAGAADKFFTPQPQGTPSGTTSGGRLATPQGSTDPQKKDEAVKNRTNNNPSSSRRPATNVGGSTIGPGT
ncbi:exported hypothetical protein [Gammaproteobacteria bacterium]